MIKAYFLIRTDLEMSKSKLAIQIGHGTDYIWICFQQNPQDNTVHNHVIWIDNDRRKIVLKVKNLDDLNKLSDILKESNIRHNFIMDKGYTEFGEETITGIVIYPIDEADLPNKVKRLRLLND